MCGLGVAGVTWRHGWCFEKVVVTSCGLGALRRPEVAWMVAWKPGCDELRMFGFVAAEGA
jgi:hypothetical protein